ncbi:MAG: universal stress protein, partial [Rhodocyclaceae bacterium]
YFGAASYAQQVLQQIDEDNPLQKSVLLTCSGLSYLDIAGAEVLAQEARRRRRLGGGLYFYRLNQTNMALLRQGGYVHDIGEGAFFPVMTNVTGALYWTLDPNVCRTCKTRIFKECNTGILPDGFRRQRLLLATDGSEFSHAPEDIAIALARSFGVTLDIMTMVESPADDEIARVRLAHAERKANIAGVACELHVRYGKQPVAEVVAAARAADSNILVIGRRPPRGDIKERLVGDIARQILLEAPCHVLVANWRAQAFSKRILVASDGSSISVTVTEVAAQIAKATGLPVTLLAAATTDAERAHAEEDLAEKLGLLKIEGIVSDSRIVAKPPEAAIIDTAQEIGADLVVIGNDQRKGLARTLAGQTTDRVVGGLACAVLVVKRPPEPDALVAAVQKQA